jgi:ubiquinone/menaquinone biosynthesis C-methylase UbiE
MEDMKYFYELFCSLPRDGPGDDKYTRKAFSYLKNLPDEPLILDIGCGHGMQTIELAKISKGKIIALDNYQSFLDILLKKAKEEGLDKSIIPKNQSMLEMDFKNNSFDIIWSEGALYFMGFQNGLNKCYHLLKNNRYLVVTEAVLLLSNLPKPLKEFWENEYPDIKDIKSNIYLIQKHGFDLLHHFTLPKSSWIDNYYSPMKKNINIFKKKYDNNEIALQTFKMCEKEIKIYNKYSDYFGYEFFIMQKK